MQAVNRYSDIEGRVAQLLDSAPPGALSLELRELSRALLSNGYTRKDLLDAYAHIALGLREAGREEQEDDLLEAMADLEGWCSPHAQI
jgi:hypothetical protein